MRDAHITFVEQSQVKRDIPKFRVGDTLKVNLRIIEEGGKERIQSFTGTCIARKGTGISETITLHRVAYGEGMERVVFLHSPLLVGVEVIRKGSVRRSKLYYLRGTSGKASKVKSHYGTQSKAAAIETAVSEETVETAV
jgi:large subunit ribosomal protein L19